MLQNPTQEEEERFNEHSGPPRNLYVEWPNGDSKFFSYGHLENSDFFTGEEKNIIRLFYMSSTLTIYGYQLKPMHLSLANHLQRLIVINDPRYSTDNEPCVIEVIVERKES